MNSIKVLSSCFLLCFCLVGCGSSTKGEVSPTRTPKETIPLPPEITSTPTATNTTVPTETATPSPEPIEFSFLDDFNTTLDYEWTWIRANDNQWSIKNESGFLEIALTSTSQVNLEGPETLLLRGMAGERFEILTRVLFEPQSNFQRVGLVIYQNRNNYVALLRGFADTSSLPGNAIYLEEKSDNGDNLWNFGTPVNNPTEVYLKLRREGATYTGFTASMAAIGCTLERSSHRSNRYP